VTVIYDAFGDSLWAASYDGPAGGADGATALALGASGGVYVTGWSEGAGGDDDFATIRYADMTSSVDGTPGVAATRLLPPFPNPSPGDVRVVYEAPLSGDSATLAVYTVDGRLVKKLAADGSGFGSAVWDGTNGAGQRVASGVYVFRLVAGGSDVRRKAVLIR